MFPPNVIDLRAWKARKEAQARLAAIAAAARDLGIEIAETGMVPETYEPILFFYSEAERDYVVACLEHEGVSCIGYVVAADYSGGGNAKEEENKNINRRDEETP